MSTKTTSSPSPQKVSVAAAATTPTLNKNLVITNNSSLNLAIIDAAATDDDQVVFEQSLKLLSTTTGAKSIAAKSSGTVVLDDTHDNNGTPTYTKLYDIIYAKTDTLFPVMSKGAMLNFKTQDYTPVTVSNDDVTVMQQAEAFTQTIAASPTSTLAQNYKNALQGSTSDASSDDDIDDNVANFFTTQTKAYQNVTLDSLIALKSYYSTYPMVWTGYQSSKTYYLYSSDGTTVTNNGSLAITIPSTIGLDKTLAGFSFTYTDANNNTKALHYIDGQFVDDPDADVPNICLVGTFILKNAITKVQTDTDIVTILTGTMYNNTVIGYDTPLPDNSNNGGGGDPSNNWSGLYTLLHPKDASGWMQLFLTFVGVVMGIDFVLKGVGAAKDGILKAKDKLGDAFTKEDATNAINDAKAKSGLNDPKYKSRMKKIKADDQANKNLDDQIKDADAKYQDRLTEDWRTSTDEKLDSISDLLEKMLESGHATPEMQDAGDALGDAYDSVNSPSTADLSKQISDLNTTIEGLQADLNTQLSNIFKNLKKQVQEELTDSQEAADKAKEITDKVTDDLEKAKEGDISDDFTPEESGIELTEL